MGKSIRDETKVEAVLAAIEHGKSLRQACLDVGYKASTFLDWVREDTKLGEQYARAREVQAHRFAEELVEIADDRSGDPARDRLRLDARKWIVSKMLPKVYGDKVDLAVSEPIKVNHSHDVTDRVLAALPEETIKKLLGGEDEER